MLERLYQLETNIIELENFKKKYSIDDLNSEVHIQWALLNPFQH